MLISDLTGIYRKYNLADDLYNRASILVRLIEERKLSASVYWNKNNCLEFLINGTLVLEFVKVETLRCTIDGKTDTIHYGRYQLIPLLDTLKGETNAQNVVR